MNRPEANAESDGVSLPRHLLAPSRIGSDPTLNALLRTTEEALATLLRLARNISDAGRFSEPFSALPGGIGYPRQQGCRSTKKLRQSPLKELSFMSSSYKWHTIVSGALRGESGGGGKFIPVAHISWTLTPGERGSHVMISPEQFVTFEDAANFAYTEAKLWVDRHVDNLTGSSPEEPPLTAR